MNKAAWVRAAWVRGTPSPSRCIVTPEPSAGDGVQAVQQYLCKVSAVSLQSVGRLLRPGGSHSEPEDFGAVPLTGSMGITHDHEDFLASQRKKSS